MKIIITLNVDDSEDDYRMKDDATGMLEDILSDLCASDFSKPDSLVSKSEWTEVRVER